MDVVRMVMLRRMLIKLMKKKDQEIGLEKMEAMIE